MLLDKMYKLKKEKLNIKKEKLFNELSKKPIDEIKKFKSERKKKKFESLKNAFKKKMEIIDCKTGKTFEEQLDDYLTKKNDENMKKMKIITNTLVSLFDSDDEGKNSNINNEQKPKIINENSTIEEIFDEAEKYYKYIKEENYYSDFNVNDINDSDVSLISQKELEIEAKQEIEKNESNQIKDEEKSEDLNKQFHETLVKYYVNDINKAKEYYYKEKLHFDITTEEGKKEKEKMFNYYLEGLQWVLYYYYRGIKNWKWYYPYHYAPMISDYSEINIDNKLYDIYDVFAKDKSEPFAPYQSLLFILPKESFNLLPECYKDIPNLLKEYFPDKIDIDYNGKYTEYESLLLVPMVDEEKMVEMEIKCRKLTPEEEKENKWGTSFLFGGNDSNSENNSCIEYDIYQKDIDKIQKNEYRQSKCDFAFPTLKTIDYDYQLSKVKQYFGRTSNWTKQIILYPKLSLKLNNDIIYWFLYYKTIFINYPMKTFGEVKGIVYSRLYYFLYNNYLYADNRYYVSDETIENIRYKYEKQGIILHHPEILCDVRKLQKIETNNGVINTTFEENYINYVPFELTSLNTTSEHFQRYMKKMNTKIGGNYKIYKSYY